MEKLKQRLNWKDGEKLTVKLFDNFDNTISYRDQLNNQPFVGDANWGIFHVEGDHLTTTKGVLYTSDGLVKIRTFKGLTRNGILIIEDENGTIESRIEDGIYYLAVKSFSEEEEISDGYLLSDTGKRSKSTIKNYYHFHKDLDRDYKTDFFNDHLLLGQVEYKSGKASLLDYIPPCFSLKLSDNDLITLNFSRCLDYTMNVILENSREFLINEENKKCWKKIIETFSAFLFENNYFINNSFIHHPRKLHEIFCSFIMKFHFMLRVYEKSEIDDLTYLNFNPRSNLEKRNVDFLKQLENYTKEPYRHMEIRKLLDLTDELIRLIGLYVAKFDFNKKVVSEFSAND